MRLWGMASCSQVQIRLPIHKENKNWATWDYEVWQNAPQRKIRLPFISKQELSYMRLYDIWQVAPQCNYVSLFIRKTRTELYEIIWDMASCSPMQLCLPIHNENKNWVIWDLRHRMHSEVSVNWFATLIIIFCKNCLDCLLLPQSRF